MTKYSDLPYSQRKHTLGSEAEGVFESAHPLGSCTRFGWDSPQDQSGKDFPTYEMPLLLRHAPDYYCKVGALVEVVGLGRDNMLKSIKPDKYDGLKEWATICKNRDLRLVLFVWNSYEEQFLLIDWEKVVKLVQASKRKGVETFSDGNEYYPIPWEALYANAGMRGSWTTQ